MPKRILIVDNSQEYRDLLRDISLAMGYETSTADRATEAWAILQRESISLMLLDIKMPAIHGDDFVRYIRKKGTQVPIIVISGYLTPKVLEVLLEHEVRKVVAKPFKVQRIAGEISKVMEGEA